MLFSAKSQRTNGQVEGRSSNNTRTSLWNARHHAVIGGTKGNNGREGIFPLNLKEFRHAATSIRPYRGPHRDRAENPPPCRAPCHACPLQGAGTPPPPAP